MCAGVDMDDRVVLYVCPCAYADVIYVAADDRAEPNARVLADLDIADDEGIFRNKS
jgi:hypothetical protein